MPAQPNRIELLKEIFTGQPQYRIKQAVSGVFQKKAKSWEDVTSLSKDMREVVIAKVPWMTVAPFKIMKSKDERTKKAILTLHDNLKIETVLMVNARGSYTICVSSQVGCAMGCVFCATGKMGLFRNLTADEIIDQYRFFCAYLEDAGEDKERITNIVFMGMGEPLKNYENVKEACAEILANTKIGPTRIVVSTVGVEHSMEKLLVDPSWPAVRVAISLHSAVEETRKKIVPSHVPGFLNFLVKWGSEYHKKYPQRRRHLSLEYVLLSGINDTKEQAQALAKFASNMGKVRVNLIFWNPVVGAHFTKSIPAAAIAMQNVLKDRGIMCIIRDTQGQDIEAACGQLIVQENKKQQKEEK